MPVYEYECKECAKVTELQQRMSDDPLKECPECNGEVKKIISSNSFQLKGGGWYSDGYSSSSKTSGGASAPASSGGCKGCPSAS